MDNHLVIVVFDRTKIRIFYEVANRIFVKHGICNQNFEKIKIGKACTVDLLCINWLSVPPFYRHFCEDGLSTEARAGGF